MDRERQTRNIPFDKSSKKPALDSSEYTKITRQISNVIGKVVTSPGIISSFLSRRGVNSAGIPNEPTVPVNEPLVVSSISSTSSISLTITPVRTYRLSCLEASLVNIIVTGSYTATGLTPNTTYTFNITNSDGNTATRTIKTLTLPPVVTGLNLISSSSTTLSLGWNNDLLNYSHFTVYYSVVGSLFWLSSSSSQSTITLTELTPNTDYAVYVVGINSSNLASNPSNTIIVTTIPSSFQPLAFSAPSEPVTPNPPPDPPAPVESVTIAVLTPLSNTKFVRTTNTSIVYSLPAPLGAISYSAVCTSVSDLITVDASNIYICEVGSILYVRIYNLNAATTYTTTLTCFDSLGRYNRKLLANGTTRSHTLLNESFNNQYENQLTPSQGTRPSLNTISRAATTKTDFLYNYFDYETITYPLVRLFGKWNTATGNLTATVNGYSTGVSWAFYNYEFKIFVKLFSSGRATYGQQNGLNTIIVTDGTTTKTVRMYYQPPTINALTPRVRCFLYDGYNGPGTCDAPPSRTDNQLSNNQNRLKMDMLLIQSFFAESYKCAREAQEGIYGLPYTTFAMELDSNDEPVVHMIYETNSTRTRSYLRNSGADGGGEFTNAAGVGDGLGVRSLAQTLYGNNLAANGGPYYLIGYSLLSHKDPVTRIYANGVADGQGLIGLMNSANLIWHPESLSQFQTAWHDQTPLPTDYNEFDNANTVQASCGRIIGSLMHELTHTIPGHDHPSQMIGLNQQFLGNYVWPFDTDNYPVAFGIDEDDATYFRNWVVSYDVLVTVDPISHVDGELGPSGLGWWSPYTIHGYTNLYQSILNTNTSGFSKYLITSISSNTITVDGIATTYSSFQSNSSITMSLGQSVIILSLTLSNQYPSLVCNSRVYTIDSKPAHNIVILKYSDIKVNAGTRSSQYSGALPIAYLVNSSNGITYNSGLRPGWINSPVLVNHPITNSSTMTFYTSSQNISVPTGFNNGYIKAHIWGSGGENYNTYINGIFTIFKGGAGGFINANIPIKSTDSIQLNVGTNRGAGVANLRSGGPYAGRGGGETILKINNVPVVIAGAGGGAGNRIPGNSVYQVFSYKYNGTNGVILGGGGDNTLVDDNNHSGCGGTGYLGGTAGIYNNGGSTASGGGGSGTSFISPLSGISIQKGASYYTASRLQTITINSTNYTISGSTITIRSSTPISGLYSGVTVQITFSTGSVCTVNVSNTFAGIATIREWDSTRTYNVHDCVIYANVYYFLSDYINGYGTYLSTRSDPPTTQGVSQWVLLELSYIRSLNNSYFGAFAAGEETQSTLVLYNNAIYSANVNMIDYSQGPDNAPANWTLVRTVDLSNEYTLQLSTGSFGSGTVSMNVLPDVAYSIKHIIPSVYDTNPIRYGSPGFKGCIGIQFISTDPTATSGYNSPVLQTIPDPSVDFSDSPSFQTLIPRPAKITTLSGVCTLNNSSVSIYYSDSSILDHAHVFKTEFINLTGIIPNVIAGTPTASNSVPPIYLYIDSTLGDSNNQYYKFNILIQTGYVQISAKDIIGIAHGTSVILQLLRVNSGVITLQNVYISDYSTCKNSGLMIDMARDPYEMGNVKYVVDLCRFYRMRFIHIHGNDEVNNFGALDSDSCMVFYWNPVGNVVNGDPITQGDNSYWFRSKTNWDNLVEYARIRGVAFIPELEAFGRGAGLRARFPLTFLDSTRPALFKLTSDACINGLKSIITQLAETFYTSPYIFIGSDEPEYVVSDFVGAAEFCAAKQIQFNTETVVHYYFYQLYDCIKNLNKQMIIWNDGNTLESDFNSNFTGLDGTVYNTNREIISQLWVIGGGGGGASDYVPGALEDFVPYNLHSGTNTLIAGGTSVLQSPWKPRIYSKMKAMFDWGVGSGLNPIYINSAARSIICKNPIPLNVKLLGSQTLLWESLAYHDTSSLTFRYKAPLRCENTYSFNKNTVGLINTALAFEYLNNKFTTVNSGVRLIESGLTESLSYKFKTATDNTIIPYSNFGDSIKLTLVKINTNVANIYYTLNSTIPSKFGNFPNSSSLSFTLGTYPFTNLDTKAIDYTNATLYTDPITINRYDSRMSRGFIIFRAQCYDSSNNPIGQVIDRRYLCRPFSIKFAGGLGEIISSIKYDNGDGVAFMFFNTKMTITVSDISTGGVVKCFIANKQFILTPTNQLNITSSTDMISIGFFDLNNNLVGSGISFYARSTSDRGGEFIGEFSPLNTYTITARSTFSITRAYTSSVSELLISSLLTSVPNYPGAVKLSCIVVGGGGSGGSYGIIGAGRGAPGGGGGGIATEVYYNVSINYKLSISVGLNGQQSALSFSNIALSDLPDRDIFMLNNVATGVNKHQDPVYPTIAYSGSNGNGTTNVPGSRGLITKGDVISASEATIGTSATHGIGGRGLLYSNFEYGKGGNGSSNTIVGNRGIIIITIEPI